MHVNITATYIFTANPACRAQGAESFPLDGDDWRFAILTTPFPPGRDEWHGGITIEIERGDDVRELRTGLNTPRADIVRRVEEMVRVMQ